MGEEKPFLLAARRKINPGETPLQAAEREMFEEIGAQSAELVPPLRELGVFISELGENVWSLEAISLNKKELD